MVHFFYKKSHLTKKSWGDTGIFQGKMTALPVDKGPYVFVQIS